MVQMAREEKGWFAASTGVVLYKKNVWFPASFWPKLASLENVGFWPSWADLAISFGAGGRHAVTYLQMLCLQWPLTSLT